MSRRHDSLYDEPTPESILSPSVIIAPITWDPMEVLQWAQQHEPTPPNCSPSKHYIPLDLRLRVMQWVHTGISCTLHLLQNSFWWSSKIKDVATYIKACQVCAQSKTPKELPSGLLQPLPFHNVLGHISQWMLSLTCPSPMTAPQSCS